MYRMAGWYGDERDPDLDEIVKLVNLQEGFAEKCPLESKMRWLGSESHVSFSSILSGLSQ